MDRLPIELISQILGHCNLSHNDALRTRLVCKAFSSCLTREAFRRIRTTFSRESFDNVVNLSQSPVAEYVVDFEYQLVPFVKLKDIHSVDPLIQLQPLYDDDPFCEDASEQQVDKTKRMADMAQELLAHHQHYLAQIDIRGTYFDIITLSKALPSFRNLRSVTASRFIGDSSNSSDLMNSMSAARPASEEESTTRAFWAIVKACLRCDPPIESLYIDSLHLPALEVPGNKRGQLREIMQHLKELRIPLLCSNSDDRTFRDKFQDDILSQLPKVEVLVLGNGAIVDEEEDDGDDGGDDQLLGHAVFQGSARGWGGWGYMQSLRVLELRFHSQMKVLGVVIKEFIADHTSSLKELVLCGLSLVWLDQGGWEDVFAALRRMVRFERVELRRLGVMVGDWSDEVSEVQLREWEQWLVKS